jgi:hypothetical protein
MKIPLRQSNDAFAVIVVFILITIMGVYVVSNAVALTQLKRELRNIEQAQKRQLELLAARISKVEAEKLTDR